MPIYHLSNAQRKDLLVRGTPIFLALPAPPHEPDDLADWARSVLPQDVRHLLHTADYDSIEVAPHPIGPRHTLTDVLGAIVQKAPPAEWFTVWIEVVKVCLLPSQEVRHSTGRLQWPSNVVIGGKPLLQQETHQ